ncbi:hypothetical protein KC320_g107 [Hortaea werneckii]|nr:hypothetical protein KC320_g107 [Hortaea werneckii]
MVSRYINWPCSIERVECLESLIETLCNVLYEVGGGIKEATKTIKKTTLFVKVEMLDLMARESQRSRPSLLDEVDVQLPLTTATVQRRYGRRRLQTPE